MWRFTVRTVLGFHNSPRNYDKGNLKFFLSDDFHLFHPISSIFRTIYYRHEYMAFALVGIEMIKLTIMDVQPGQSHFESKYSTFAPLGKFLHFNRRALMCCSTKKDNQ